MVDLVVAGAFVKMLQRLRKWRDEREDRSRGSVEISRGAAALVAAVHVSEQYAETGAIVVEAVEEPSSVAGHDVTELSYVGVESCWIVLLRSDAHRRRYVVVVIPDGTIAGAVVVPFLPHEDVFLRPADFG